MKPLTIENLKKSRCHNIIIFRNDEILIEVKVEKMYIKGLVQFYYKIKYTDNLFSLLYTAEQLISKFKHISNLYFDDVSNLIVKPLKYLVMFANYPVAFVNSKKEYYDKYLNGEDKSLVEFILIKKGEIK